MEFYTDGSAHPNPGPGGLGIVGVENDKVVFAKSYQYDGPVTNNEMELKAIVYSDSSYCVNTFNDWMFSWQKRGWVKSDKKIPENLDIIKTYYEWYQLGYRIDLRKIKGHNGHEWNEMADDLATGKISDRSLYVE